MVAIMAPKAITPCIQVGAMAILRMPCVVWIHSHPVLPHLRVHHRVVHRGAQLPKDPTTNLPSGRPQEWWQQATRTGEASTSLWGG